MYTATRDDSRELEALIGQLADQASSRSATSPGEATAAAFVNGRLRRTGMGVATYELRASPRLGGVYLLFGALGLLAAALALAFPLLSLLLALNLLGWVALDSFGVPTPPIGRRRASQNIVGTRAVAGAAGLKPIPPRWRVVLMAPLDAPQVRLGLAALAGPTRGAALARLAAIALVAAGAAALLLRSPWWLVGLPGALGCLLVAVASIMPPTPAPADGGVAALATMVTAAQRIEQLERVELWAVAVGAAGTDPRGVTTLLPRYPFDRARTLFIALEDLAGGQVVYATREGASGPADELLLRLAAAADAADPLIDAEPRPLEVPGRLAAPLRRHGYRALTILARPAPGARPDLVASLDPRLVERAARMVVAIVRRLEAEA
ncbi:MAG: hypothetical protein HGA45_11275 [Chloroflexales bacterium]|nr:hypothetical protein [Chloroflexales bacterium]